VTETSSDPQKNLPLFSSVCSRDIVMFARLATYRKRRPLCIHFMFTCNTFFDVIKRLETAVPHDVSVLM